MRSWPSSAGALEPRSVSLALSSSLVGWGENLAQLKVRERQLEHAVTEVRGPVPGRVAGRDEQAFAPGLDDRTAAREDRRVARAATARQEQFAAIRAKRVEDALQSSARSRDQDNVSLVGRRIADVAPRSGDQRAAGDVERRRELLVLGVTRDGDRPAALLVSVAERELVDQPIRGGGVDGAAIGVGDRAGRRDLGATGPAADAKRGEGPKDARAAGVDRERLAICRGHEDQIACRARGGHAVQVDRRGVDGPRQRHREMVQAVDVGGGDAARCAAAVAARRIKPELGPVEQACGGNVSIGWDRSGACCRGRNLSRRA